MNNSNGRCEGCGNNHSFEDCPNKEDIKKLVIARLENMPPYLRVSIG